ncbi:hypothetical protein EH165_02040 [Nakamurella antarctica]|uniref:Uncharacterized protein n=1 Tax=Nakamurella antarctica TaxID=1902245 RepID=A0A3G8ZIV9_9ACTN|nr:hypothetical protein EH165_02040 [Nakamurella antarctica]
MAKRKFKGVKWVGLAGAAGVAATGVLIARNERQRRAYTPDDVRARLVERASAAAPRLPVSEPGPADESPRRWLRVLQFGALARLGSTQPGRHGRRHRG